MNASSNTGDASGLSTASLEALQNVEQASLMDLVDKLRRNGASAHLQLPQIVVCGDQSSGKSSTLEALTGIPFPRKENLCTRFATEISMRRDPKESISCQINPDDSRNEAEKTYLRAFSQTITQFSELPTIIDAATKVMGLDATKAFSKDVLSIVICGPDRPQLTVVDLPGLIHSSNKSQTEADVDLIKALVNEYISAKRTIILAVVSAKNDYANQIILKMCRKVDRTGSRTLGVITKPDFLRPGSENEAAWLDLAENRDIHFDLGWHILKNLGDEEHHLSFHDREVKEKLFFDSGKYKALPQHDKGIASLRDRLSHLLYNHLRQEMPKLKHELDKLLLRTNKEIKALGRSRGSAAEQKIYLTEVLNAAHEIVDRAVRGTYEGDFFHSIGFGEAIDHHDASVRLRARVQILNSQFAEAMNQRGHKYDIRDTGDANSTAQSDEESNAGQAKSNDEAEDDDDEENDKDFVDDSNSTDDSESSDEMDVDGNSSDEHTSEVGLPQPTVLHKDDALNWVVEMLQRNRGVELPGMFNPLIVSHLFWSQSEPWERLARDHVKTIAATCRRFIMQALDHCVSSLDKSRIMTKIVAPALKQALSRASNELDQIIKDKANHPITYNHYFTDSLQKLHHSRYESEILKLSANHQIEVQLNQYGEKKTYIDPVRFKTGLQGVLEHNMDKFAAQQALDAQKAFYKDERKYFVDIIAKQVIERHLVSPMPSILSPLIMARLSDKEIDQLVGEPAHTTLLRERLVNKRVMLEDSSIAFTAAMEDDIESGFGKV